MFGYINTIEFSRHPLEAMHKPPPSPHIPDIHNMIPPATEYQILPNPQAAYASLMDGLAVVEAGLFVYVQEAEGVVCEGVEECVGGWGLLGEEGF